jgi:hypothetical protein
MKPQPWKKLQSRAVYEIMDSMSVLGLVLTARRLGK